MTTEQAAQLIVEVHALATSILWFSLAMAIPCLGIVFAINGRNRP